MIKTRKVEDTIRRTGQRKTHLNTDQMATCMSEGIFRSFGNQYDSDKFKPCTEPDVGTCHLHNASLFVLRQKYLDYD